jgi:hypothetical protein
MKDRYRELIRVSRQWRHLKQMKWHGFGHEPDRIPTPGSLAIFCPSCPQPGLNLPSNLPATEAKCVLLSSLPSDLIEFRWLYTRSYVMDGNFSAEHLKMRRPDTDVRLSDGLGFMVTSGDYKAHLNLAVERSQVCAS